MCPVCRYHANVHDVLAPAPCLVAQDGSLKGLEGVPLAHHLLTAAHRRFRDSSGRALGCLGSVPACLIDDGSR
jgi:hypothetical protein